MTYTDEDIIESRLNVWTKLVLVLAFCVAFYVCTIWLYSESGPLGKGGAIALAELSRRVL